MMPLDQATALLWTQRILGCGLLIQTAELFWGRRIYARDAALSGGNGLCFGLTVRGAISLWLIAGSNFFYPAVTALTLAILLISSAWLAAR